MNEQLESTPLDNPHPSLVSNPCTVCPTVAKPPGPPDTVVSSNPLTLTPATFILKTGQKDGWLEFSGCEAKDAYFPAGGPVVLPVTIKADWIGFAVDNSAAAGTYPFSVTVIPDGSSVMQTIGGFLVKI